jgi:hypothetical protein
VLVGHRIASIRRVFERAWGHVRWKIVAIIILMGSSAVLLVRPEDIGEGYGTGRQTVFEPISPPRR